MALAVAADHLPFVEWLVWPGRDDTTQLSLTNHIMRPNRKENLSLFLSLSLEAGERGESECGFLSLSIAYIAGFNLYDKPF